MCASIVDGSTAFVDITPQDPDKVQVHFTSIRRCPTWRWSTYGDCGDAFTGRLYILSGVAGYSAMPHQGRSHISRNSDILDSSIAIRSSFRCGGWTTMWELVGGSLEPNSRCTRAETTTRRHGRHPWYLGFIHTPNTRSQAGRHSKSITAIYDHSCDHANLEWIVCNHGTSCTTAAQKPHPTGEHMATTPIAVCATIRLCTLVECLPRIFWSA